MIQFRTMTEDDIPAAQLLWQASPGICLGVDDSRDALARYLKRNPGMSFVALAEQSFLGVALAGHDGRRGLLHHVAVAKAWQKQGIARELVQRCLDVLKAQGITKVHIMVLEDNEMGLGFWTKLGWQERRDVKLLSVSLTSNCLSECECTS